MTMNSRLMLGYDLDKWNLWGVKEPISVDISPKTNSLISLNGMSGSGKSYMEHQLLARLILAEQRQKGEYYFADYKGDNSFSYLQSCSHFFTYKDSFTALDTVHARLLARQSGSDTTNNPVTLIWDEYMAAALNFISEDKKAAAVMMSKVSEILLLGRSLSVRLIVACQRPDALAFPAGSRLNYGVVCVLGAAVRSIYEMLLPDHMEQVKGRKFERGEGVVLLQGSELRFIKVPMVRDEERMRQICIKALGGPI
ncbi:ATP-binding protein [Colidextribacter sp. OB.20]|uniref:ATP-binding protein n=1 Tax=Colidextribacter sp. OB.20 TaxID=2304568 RepID=UPI00136C8A71|nr:ATP-binding protein [Colidextribacter sp. OB.20]NBI10738.1 ATP-binding protein [Colidextribacter sp. OB.20]